MQKSEIEKLSLYFFPTCPFCQMVLQAIDSLGIEIELRDIHSSPQHNEDLLEGGGRSTVPCLRIDLLRSETQWMYESRDIIAFLQSLFG